MEITKVKFKIRGICPILFDRHTGEAPSTDEEAKKQAPNKVYRDKAGNLSIPGDMVKASIRNAYREIGKKQECAKREQAFRAGALFDQDMYSLAREDFDGLHAEFVTRKGQGKKVTRVMSYRAYVLEGWEIQGTVMLYAISAQVFLEAITLAGFKWGLASHRPEFGRFEVLECEEVVAEQPEKVKKAKKVAA